MTSVNLMALVLLDFSQQRENTWAGSSGRGVEELDFFLSGVEQLYAVQPSPWCPHLTCVQPLPPGGLDTSAPCQDCGDTTENWVCLVCYKVFCSRYVQEHMLFHSIAEEGHLMVLSYSDLSVWCYACNDYIDNQITHPMKDAAHRSKFGEALPSYFFIS
ncbi:hypothetical protein BaRGS_00013208 [Batillaria attramentaria]|uniref:UBP-type domain-containing protein n=1 Tax=Batillaria attramentaria TaxID=370345 RepID=A0ABD0L8A7_9CAEN